MFIDWLSINVYPWFLESGITLLAIIIVGYLIKHFSGRVIEKVIRKAVPPSSFLSPVAERKREDTLIKIFGGVVSVLIWLIALLMILSELNVDIGPLLAGAGLLGVAIGFGAQYLVRDVITGLFIILENQYRIGDTVCFGDTCGSVENITLRITTLRDVDGVVHTIPNGEIKVTSNKSKEFSKVNIEIGVSYDSDLDKVEKVINKVGDELATDEAWKSKIRQAPMFLRVSNLGDSSVDVLVTCETEAGEQWAVAGEIRKRIKVAFEKAKIEIPYPQRVIRQIK